MSVEKGNAVRNRQPKQLLLAFLGEHVLDQDVPPLRASALIEVLEGAGVAAPATRATLDRMVQRGLLTRERRGREILFSLTAEGGGVLRGATARVRGPRPFEPHGTGWTLVTFSVPEDQRTLRHRLRSALTWNGFAPLRDGLWLAPGEVDLDAVLEPLRGDLPAAAITAFHARELPGYAMADNVRAAWDIDSIREVHLGFIATWSAAATIAEARSPLSARAMLVADWLALLAADPRLPRAFMDDDWPADRSYDVYRAAWSLLEQSSAAQFTSFVSAGAQRRSS